MHPFNLIVVLGPTASGKTRLGVQLAEKLGGEIISADSRQVFRGMDLGTGKDLAEYGDVPYHLIDIRAGGEEFSVFDFQQLFYDTFTDITARNRLPLLVGGTGLYLEAALGGKRMLAVAENPALRRELASLDDEQLRQRLLDLRPRQHNTTDLNDRDRLVRAIEIASGEDAAAGDIDPPPAIRPLVFGTRWERTVLRRRITQRLQERLDTGMIAEVEQLLDAGVTHASLEYYGLEYRFISRHLQGELNRNDMVQKLNSAIHQFAKRQETWFRRMERRGTVIHWLDGTGDMLGAALEIIRAQG